MTDKEPNPQLAGGSAEYRANDIRGLLGQVFSNERLIVTIVLGLVVAFAVFDFFEDRAGGASADILFNDVSDVFLPMLLLAYIWRFTPLFQHQKTRELETDLASKSADLQHWKETAAGYLQGLSESIDKQFDNWQLTRAEKEIALLLLKGFSLRELASMRGTSERTVRQQATRIYEKAGLRGRAELSAFFLEDLMLPTTETAE